MAGLIASSASAHVAIVLTIVEPSAGEVVGPDLTIVVHAQPTIGGVNSTRFTLELDGRTLPAQVDRPIRVNQDVRVPLKDLRTGRHVATVRFRPDTDEPETVNEVVFVVGETGGGSLSIPLVAALAGVALAGALVLWRSLTPGR